MYHPVMRGSRALRLLCHLAATLPLRGKRLLTPTRTAQRLLTCELGPGQRRRDAHASRRPLAPRMLLEQLLYSWKQGKKRGRKGAKADLLPNLRPEGEGPFLGAHASVTEWAGDSTGRRETLQFSIFAL